MFIDRVQIKVEAGRGGDGCLSFRRERFIPRGGPDGGDGGEGGSVVIRAAEGVDHLALAAHRKHWRARSGSAGQGSNRHGRSAKDTVIEVPPGTVVRDFQKNFILKDLKQAGDSVVAAKGGRGGKGNAHFKSATNRAPRQFTRGEAAEVRSLVLELKVIADVGLIGKPNAGKSTLLARLSRAKPAIADYPFTTKRPHLGRVDVDRDQSFVLADIPGLIEGAHQGVGLGLEFLRHIERTKLFVHLVEPMPSDQTNPVDNYRSVRHELLQYEQALGERPEIVVVTKMELPDAEMVRAELTQTLDKEVLGISAVTGAGLDRLMQTILSHLQREAVA
ncbi:MAG: GTPase ObgE [Pirellulales bacterium]|nr:GTPase ObgE [Pirellulales bacterium]